MDGARTGEKRTRRRRLPRLASQWTLADNELVREARERVELLAEQARSGEPQEALWQLWQHRDELGKAKPGLVALAEAFSDWALRDGSGESLTGYARRLYCLLELDSYLTERIAHDAIDSSLLHLLRTGERLVANGDARQAACGASVRAAATRRGRFLQPQASERACTACARSPAAGIILATREPIRFSVVSTDALTLARAQASGALVNFLGALDSRAFLSSEATVLRVSRAVVREGSFSVLAELASARLLALPPHQLRERLERWALLFALPVQTGALTLPESAALTFALRYLGPLEFPDDELVATEGTSKLFGEHAGRLVSALAALVWTEILDHYLREGATDQRAIEVCEDALRLHAAR